VFTEPSVSFFVDGRDRDGVRMRVRFRMVRCRAGCPAMPMAGRRASISWRWR